MRYELVSSVDAFFSNLHFFIWIIEEMPTRLPLKDSQTTGKMLNNCAAVIVLDTKLLKTYLCSLAVYMYRWKNSLQASFEMDGHPKALLRFVNAVSCILTCIQFFLFFSYNHFTGHKQETELNWNPKRGVTSVLYLIPWSRMYLTDLTCQIKETTEQSGNDLNIYSICGLSWPTVPGRK